MPDTYLTTQYRDREQVKSLGARWDPGRRQWFVPSGRDLTPFQAWLVHGVAEPPPVPSALTPGPYRVGSELSPPTPAAPGAGATTTAALGRKGIPLSELLASVAQAVARALPSGAWTVVEVTNLRAKNGHVWLELAERSPDGTVRAQASAVIWESVAEVILPEFERVTGSVLASGIKLLVHAKPRFHVVYGLSLEIDGVDPEYTLGELEARKREIRARLQREGLFDRNRKLAKPWDFNLVLVVSPQDAAGLGDFQAEARQLDRCGVCRFHYAHARFQGPGAPEEILAALRSGLAATAVDGRASPDAVVIIRGGGATNDLAWLNDYELARFVCLLDIPVLTGIGHERDSTVLDEVANTSFDTPSKVVASIVNVIAARIAEARLAFDDIRSAAVAQVSAATAVSERRMASIASDVGRQVTLAHRHVTAFLAQLRTGSARQTRSAAASSRALVTAVEHLAVQHARDARQASTARMTDLAATSRRMIVEAIARSQALVREIVGQGPERTLGRGFAIVRNAQRETITHAAQLSAGTDIGVEFRDGEVAARVKNT